MKTTAKKLTALILSLIFIISSAGISAFADEETSLKEETSASEQTTETTTEKKLTKKEAQKELENQRKDLEKKVKESEKLLAGYKDEAKVTEDYINTLDEKIGYINEELNVLDKQISAAQKKIKELNKQIKPLEKELKSLEKAYDEAKKEFDELSDEFNKTYDAYCMRLRAVYISGGTSVLAALLTSKDLSQFINRIEMIRAISRSDAKLLKKVNAQMEQIITRQDGLNAKKAEVLKAKKEIKSKQDECKKQQESVESKQQEIATKKVALAESRAQSDSLFAEYTAKTQMYTEFRNEDEELINSVNSEIDALLGGLKSPDEVTTAHESEHDPSKVTTPESSGSTLYSKSNAVLNLTYPTPGYYAVSQEFGHYRNGRAHTGIDFPLPTGSKVVASQNGIVITVKRLNYSYGYYIMVYHGTDANGRKIVTLYAHNSSILVSVGQSVKKGEQIARAGSTGNSTGPHCHFEVIINGAKVNPKNYLSR